MPVTLFDRMLESYEIDTSEAYLAATREVMQKLALAGLHRGGFFETAAFYGGTALRLLFDLDRTSEDMDFSLIAPGEDFSLQPYFSAITEEFRLAGREVSLSEKKKSSQTAIDSAFLKDTTRHYDLTGNLMPTVKIKIEVDTLPPVGFETAYQLCMLPYSFMVRCYTLPSSFAGKMSTVLYRAWGNRVKGRDWYDFEWYVRNNIAMNLSHFNARARQIALLEEDVSEQGFRELLYKKINATDFNKARIDVIPFINDASKLDIWSPDYFHQVANRMKIIVSE